MAKSASLRVSATKHDLASASSSTCMTSLDALALGEEFGLEKVVLALADVLTVPLPLPPLLSADDSPLRFLLTFFGAKK